MDIILPRGFYVSSLFTLYLAHNVFWQGRTLWSFFNSTQFIGDGVEWKKYKRLLKIKIFQTSPHNIDFPWRKNSFHFGQFTRFPQTTTSYLPRVKRCHVCSQKAENKRTQAFDLDTLCNQATTSACMYWCHRPMHSYIRRSYRFLWLQSSKVGRNPLHTC